MTKEEAKEILTHNWTRVDNPNYSESELDEAFFLAIEALSVANLKEEFESAVPNCQKCAIKELWEETEKEDLVSVVRCKDCRWWNSETKGCKRNPSVEAWHETDFCKYGERQCNYFGERSEK